MDKQNTVVNSKPTDKLKAFSSPHMKSVEKTSSLMFDVIIALVFAYGWGIYTFGLRALLVGIVSVVTCVISEAVMQFIMHRRVTISDLSAVVTGMLFAMTLPSTIPLWIVVAGDVFAIVIIKQLFGGLGCNIINPALGARVFVGSWADKVTYFTEFGIKLSASDSEAIDAVSGATALVQLKNGTLPETNLFDMIIGNMGGCIGEVSALLLLAGGIYLIIRRVISWQIPLAFIGTVAVITFLFPQYNGLASDYMLAHLFSGGLFLGAFFMATDPATSPVTGFGKFIFGIGCGLITVLIRYFGAYNEGVGYAVLMMNLFVYYLDRITMPKIFGGRK